MSRDLTFVEASPQAVAPGLDAGSIDLWRLPYAMSHRRAPMLTLLAAYLGVSAEEVVLEQRDQGKPHLASMFRAGAGLSLDFNWSHSGELALVAITRAGTVGVDIERADKNLRSLEIAQRFFDPSEAEALQSLAPDSRDHAFIGLWCAKESVLKAAGHGLSFGLARLVFAHRGAADWTLERIDPMLGDVRDWRLAGFDAAPGYRGSLAWCGSARRIRPFQPARIDTA
ncbi:MAG: 4'-phosphopantetheinyl transferase superfamily protein [Xanthomonadaceae bacterium]|nr:4'-phosphopantetheinyl transferase superfamily protein [Xanthomonadaceae bacterium]